MAGLDFSERVIKLSEQAMKMAEPAFAAIDANAGINTAKVLAAFQKHRVAEPLFAGTTGYGYDDRGREVLEDIFADVFGGEAGLVRMNFVNGTHAIGTALFSLLGPGDTLLSITGAPYDTLQTVVGLRGNVCGSLTYYGIKYRQVELTPEGKFDIPAIKAAAPGAKSVFIQRSRGYTGREAFTIEEIEEACRAVREVNESAAIIADNCYGEFVETKEPLQVGADLIAGSLIKNPGGGLAHGGGYVVGRKDLVDSAAERLTMPGIGGECGATHDFMRTLYQGFFLAPHTVAQALKTAVFAAAMMELLGYETSPGALSRRSDIIQRITFNDPQALIRFCRGIQAGSPVDSFVTPEPWQMPGYDCPVIMAAGAFVQGSSIELSADGPMRPPYSAYLQGSLTFEAGKLGIMFAAEELLRE